MAKTIYRVIRVAVGAGNGGLATQILTLDEVIDHSSFAFTYVFLRRGGRCAAELRSRGRDVYEFGLTSRNLNRLATFKLYHLFRIIRPDIVHSSAGTGNFFSSIAARIAKVPVMIGEEISVPDRRLRARLKFSLAHALSDRVVAVSSATRTYLIEKEFCDKAKIKLIYNAYPSHFDMLPTTTVERAGSDFNILMVSRLSPEKNHLTILHALKRLIENFTPNITLTIVGDGSFAPEIKRMVDELKIDSHVTFTGYRSDISDLMQSSDLYVLPSTSEGFGIALAEAMRAGVLVLGSNAGGIPEVLSGYPKEHVIPALDVDQWVDAIELVMQMDPSQRMHTINLGIRLATDRFSATIHGKNIERLYRDTLNHTNSFSMDTDL